jgi:hypothetical protein
LPLYFCCGDQRLNLIPFVTKTYYCCFPYSLIRTIRE